MNQADRDRIEDLGLIEDDNTPDMRKAPVAPEALRSEHHVGHQTNRSSNK